MAKKTYLDENGLSYLWGKITDALGLKVNSEEGKTLTSNDFTDELKAKLDGIASGATANTGTITDVTLGGTSVVTGSVANIPAMYTKEEVDAKISSVYKPQGSIASTALPTPSASNLGYVYNVTDEFTTTNVFLEGAGKTYPAGTNVAVVENGSDYKLDALAGWIDTSDFVTEDDITAITNATIDSITA